LLFGSMERIFISHGHDQERLARALAESLAAHGLRSWLAVASVEPGQAIARAVREAAETSDGAVLVVDPREP
jgi:hypothetical protein